MHAVLHILGAVLVLPYAGLAALFLLIDEVARAKGLLAMLDVLLDQFVWIVPWGALSAAVLWLALVVGGCIARLRQLAALCLGLLALGSLGVITRLQSSPLEAGQITFLAPCAAVCAMSAWLVTRPSGLGLAAEGERAR